MRAKLFTVVLLSIITLLAFNVVAESNVQVTPIDNQIAIGETAKFELKITNNAEEEQSYSVFSFQSGQGWNVDVSPLKDKIIDLTAGESYTTTVIAQAIDEELSPGIYHLHIAIESNLGEDYSEALKIYLSPEKPVDYLPAIKVDVDMPEKINPKESISVKLLIENRNPLDLKDLQLEVQSEMPEFVKTLPIDLPPLEKKTVKLTIQPDEHQQPKDYTLFFVFKRDGETVKVVEQEVEIVPLLPKFNVESKKDTVFLKQFHQLTVTNEGNVKNTQQVKVEAPLWKVMFTDFKGEITSDENGRYLTWGLEVGPDESVVINYVTNYRIMLYLLVLILIFTGFYLYVQTPLSVKKEALTTKKDEGDSLSEIKVTLEIRNKKNKPIKDLNVTDLVPGIANVEKSLELGTLRPKTIKHTKQGTKVIWSLAELDAGEHRLITYKVKAKLNILGTFSLPRAVVEFAKKGKKKGKAYSNVYKLGVN